ncbi:Protein bfr2 [Cyphellophora attinorum]|uniref:Protein BFR2 n=1 Tax=Cyphellophora attinorum TaxID=1664694 RepID=A0A0N0NLI2_9EURO|nr:Protein bfr2 [Phialophora attinorum]KPI39331.1 Protein bfr2 [Phialophora attinorum]
MSTLKKRAEKLKRKRPQDIDPEDDPARYRDEEDSSAGSEDDADDDGREHYEAVSKSKLRKPEQPRLDPKYGGVAISRADLDEDDDPFAAVEDSEDEDPFAVDGGEEAGLNSGAARDEDDEEDVSEDSEIENDINGTSNDQGVGLPDDDVSVESDVESEDESEEVNTNSDDSDTSMDEEAPSSRAPITARDRMRAQLSRKTAESKLVSSLVSSATDQARKGAAVQQQNDAHDRLLDARIKLQKALTTSNQLENNLGVNDIESAATRAQEAALTLWSTIDSIRCDILAHSQKSALSEHSSKKRKISPLDPSPSTALSALYSQTQSLESTALPVRQSALNHWYARTRPNTSTSASSGAVRSALSLSGDDTTISSILSSYLTTNLSNLTTSAQPAPTTYNDTPFYQSLLTSLISSRTNAAAISSALPPTSTPAINGIKPPRVKSNRDTKASKGRKIRYTVHEKLLNFMAPEDRSTWTTEARREFFGSLFGGVIAEDGDSRKGHANGNDHDSDDDLEAGGLRLFAGVTAA